MVLGTMLEMYLKVSTIEMKSDRIQMVEKDKKK